MVVYEKIYLKAYINNQNIWLKNNTAQIYFILGRASFHWNFSSLLRNATENQDFQQYAYLNFLLSNLWISEPYSLI